MSAPDSLLILPLPELFRDEVFRIETKRLWLRWPSAGDAEVLEQIAAIEASARGAGAAPHPLLAGKVVDRIATARIANERGNGLVLALAHKGAVGWDKHGAPIGLVTADPARGAALSLCFLLDVRHQGQGLMTEAVHGLVDALFAYGSHRVIRGPAALANHAGRRVLEKCGFAASAEQAGRPARLQLERDDWRHALRVPIGPARIDKDNEMCSACAA